MRNDLRNSAEQYLRPGENLETAFPATTSNLVSRLIGAILVIATVAGWLVSRFLRASSGGTNLSRGRDYLFIPLVIFFLALAFLLCVDVLITRRRLIFVTNERVLVVSAKRWSYKAGGVRAELARDTVLGPASDIFHVIELGGERLRVGKPFLDDVAKADWQTRFPAARPEPPTAAP